MSRRKSGSLKPKTVLTSIVLCAAACLAGIGYVWSKTEVWGLGREMKRLETRRDELKRQNDALERTYAAMCTHERLQARVKELGLDLAAPTLEQMLRLPEPAPAVQPEPDRRFYAARERE